MKYYSIDTEARHIIYFILAVASVGLALALSPLTHDTNQLFLKIAAPDAMGIFGLLVWLFDTQLWKKRCFHWLTDTPNLEGSWSGTLRRLGQQGSPDVVRTVTMTITQNWLRMNIVLEGERSKSVSEVISLYIADKRQITLKWIYIAKDRMGIESANLYGEGTTEVTLRAVDGKRKLTGKYYSSKLRQGFLDLSENAQ